MSDAGTNATVGELVTGWKNVGARVGFSAEYLKHRQANGTLPVAPLKIGHSIAYTGAMLDQLRSSLPAK